MCAACEPHEAPRQARGTSRLKRAACVDSGGRIHAPMPSPAGVVKVAGFFLSGNSSAFSFSFCVNLLCKHGMILTNSATTMQVPKEETKRMELPRSHLDYVLRTPRTVPLDAFMRQLEGPLIRDRPAGQDQGHYPRRLQEEAQRVFYLSIQLLLDVLETGYCPENLNAANIILTLPDLRPRFHEVEFEQNPNNATVDAAMSALARVFENILWENLPYGEAVPDEVNNLLYLTRRPNVFRFTEPIQYNSCLVPLENRGHLFLVEYQYTMDVLRKVEPLHFRFVTTQVAFPTHWEILATSNLYVEGVLERGYYDALGNRDSTFTLVEPWKLHRNAPCHCLQDAANRRAPHGLGFQPADTNQALYIMAEYLLSSLQLACTSQGWASRLPPHSLFVSLELRCSQGTDVVGSYRYYSIIH